MPYIKISTEALAAIEAYREAPPPRYCARPAQRTADGYEIWVEEDTLTHLQALQLAAETISNAIIRIAALYKLATLGGRHCGGIRLVRLPHLAARMLGAVG
jgi:hypothetical protein